MESLEDVRGNYGSYFYQKVKWQGYDEEKKMNREERWGREFGGLEKRELGSALTLTGVF